jgi:polar amino acid transport system permease protein
VQDFLANFANLEALARVYPLLLQGLQVTILLSLVTVPFAIALGLVVATLYSFHLRFLNPMLILYVDALRSFPVLVLLVLIFYGLPFVGIKLAAFPAAVLAIALNNSGYYGEIFRAGIEAVPRGQTEAARSTGLSAWQAAFSVVLPQAVRNVVAPLAGNTLELIKTTSIATVVALPELLRSARVAQESTYNPTPLTAAALIYLVLLWPLARLVARLERKMVASH